MGTTMVPQNIRVKSMMSRLSNAVSHAWFRYLSVFVCSFEDSSFLRIFEAKNHIFVYTLKLNKIMNVSSFVSFDLGKPFRWSTQHWKAQTSYFSTRIFLGTIVVPMISKNDLHSVEFLNKKFSVNLQMKYYSYIWYPSGTQNLKNKKYRIWAF